MKTTREILVAAKRASLGLSALTSEKKNKALEAMALSLLAGQKEILEANAIDVKEAEQTLSPVMLDRLTLNEERVRAMAQGIRDLIPLDDPVGRVLEEVRRPNGLLIRKVSVPIGVVAIIYESRPNVTSDAAALALKSGNVCILRSGKEAFRSAFAIVGALKRGLADADVDPDLLQLVEDTGRESAVALMEAVGFVDLLIPRGGAGLIRACVERAKVPVIQTGTGICHIFVDESADFEQALTIIENAKASRPSVCNAAEVCLVHRGIAPSFLPALDRVLYAGRAARGLHPVTFFCDAAALPLMPHGQKAGEQDFDREFLDYVMAVAVVDDVEAAIAHIAAHSTHHSEAILSKNEANIRRFTSAVDSAAVYVNASTRFTDGGEFGLGCEMGISTQKLHARGPMGLRELNTYKYIVSGDGQIR